MLALKIAGKSTMIQTAANTYRFYLGRASYRRISALSWLLFSAFLGCTILSVLFSIRLLPTYAHTFTLYLKWQDTLVALSWGVALFALGQRRAVGRRFFDTFIAFKQS